VGLVGGDLCRTVGGPGDRARLADGRGVRLPIDVVRAELDGSPHWFVAHLVAHRRWWRGEAAVAMNAEWLGPWKLGPRAHPGDGLVDVTRGSLPWRDRWRARARAHRGDHLPHPRLTVVRAASMELTFPRPTPVWLDGRPAGRCRHVVLTVEPDAAAIVV
jgi:diacylglycerol kinase family enzyme